VHDRIIEGYLKDFVEVQGLHDLDPTQAFEYFINHLIISRDYPEPFELDDISVGGGSDLGIDGLGIIVNEHLVFSNEDIDFFKKQLRRLDARFLFVQSKTSANFDSGDIGNFLFGVRTFFTNVGVENEQIGMARSLKEHIYDSSGDMDEAPHCDLYYVTLGKWLDDEHLVNRVNAEVQLLRDTNLFSEVRFIPLAGIIRETVRE
jgi:hypothetical protein